MSGAAIGLQPQDPTIADPLKPLGYATGQFGKNHLGDRNEFLPTAHGSDEFFGNLYHLNAEEEPELPDYPNQPATRLVFRRRFPDDQFHCHQFAVCGSASRLPLPVPLLQMTIQRAEAQTSTLAKLASPHTAVHKLGH
jgi:hypothetical protein